MDATSINDFSQANVIGQMNTNYDEIIDQIKEVNHFLTPRSSYPELVQTLLSGVSLMESQLNYQLPKGLSKQIQV